MAVQADTQAGTTTMTLPGDREIHVERIFNAPRDKVWRAYTDRDLVSQWWGRESYAALDRLLETL